MRIHRNQSSTTATAQSYSAAQIEKAKQKRRAEEARKWLQTHATLGTSLTSEETAFINHWTTADPKPTQYYY